MKILFITIVSFCFLLTACKKLDPAKALAEDKGCMEQITIPITMHGISNSQIIIANNLFLSNNIDNRNFRYYQYLNDSVQTYFSPYLKYDSKTIRLDQYTNGLRLFTGQLVFNFKNNVFNFKGGNTTNGTNLNTTSSLTLGQLRKLFMDNIEQFDHNSNHYKDSCLTAEFGYYNLNSGITNSTENLVKAWKVTLKSSLTSTKYPVAYYQDDEGELIYYDNGIRTFK